MIPMDTLWTWIAALLTLAIFSFLYKDNPFYKFAEHLFVGISAGYWVMLDYYNSVVPNLIVPVFKDHNFWFIIPGLLGILFFTRFIPKLGFLILLPISFYIGGYAGLYIGPGLQARLLKQLQGSMLSPADFADPGMLINKVIVLIGILGSMLYFYFSKEHKGVLKVASNIGIWFIMVGFGAAFGYTVMARASLLIGRVQFLLMDWLRLIR
jgi:hypothetical protein